MTLKFKRNLRLVFLTVVIILALVLALGELPIIAYSL